jgi:8-oxo-dGTP pyrophosphatase MutT (NUDIX family)
VIVSPIMSRSTERPKKPKRAATIILIKESSGELQVFLLRRSGRSGFFPSTYVFPGGTVDLEDLNAELWREHGDMDVDAISGSLGGGLSVEEAIAYGVTAIRETFEEAGVLLAVKDEGTESHQNSIRNRRISDGLDKDWLRELVVSEGWTLAFSRLARWAHWITPELMAHRFDTRFFLAFVPPDQECTPDTRETTHGIWVSPAQGLAANLEGQIPLSPPALVTLQELLHYRDIKDLEKEARSRSWGEARLPRLIPLPEGSVILQPWDPMRHLEFEIDPNTLSESVLPVGAPFSRVWYHEGVWKPVGC